PGAGHVASRLGALHVRPGPDWPSPGAGQLPGPCLATARQPGTTLRPGLVAGSLAVAAATPNAFALPAPHPLGATGHVDAATPARTAQRCATRRAGISKPDAVRRALPPRNRPQRHAVAAPPAPGF